MSELRLGQRVFHRRADGFGVVKALRSKDGGNLASIQYEWPWDPKADLFEVPVAELVDEYDAPLAPRRPPTLADQLIDAAGLRADIEEGRDPVEAMVDLRRSYNSAQDEAIRLRERIRKALDYATVGGVIGANVIEEALRG